MLEIRNLTKIYRSKTGETVKALDHISVTFPSTGMVFILGKSGSGKSTLLNIMGGLDSYDSGEFIIKGKSSNEFGGSDFDAYRNTFIGFIFQEYNVLDDFTVGANIGLALELQGKRATDEAINKILAQVDLLTYAKRKPNELSGGQKQRVAIARALVKEPEIIMADEPTGALDSNTGKQIFDTLKELSKEKLVLVVSHDRDFAERYADRIIELADGRIIEDVTKHEHQAERVSDGVHRINDHILRIERGYRLTASDLEMINAYLAKNEGDVLLSGDGRVNEELRSAAGISSDGATTVFEGTGEGDVVTKSYGKEDAKFIRSRLPMKNAVKMGASGLKHKKFRLFMTIFLSFISFAMFGLSSSLAAYERIEAATQSIIDSEIRSAAVTLGVRRTTTWDDGDSYTAHDGHGMNLDDIAWLKQQTGLDFVPVFTGKTYNNVWESNHGFDMTDMMLDYSDNLVYDGSLAGFVDVDSLTLPAEYTYVAGAKPTNAGEIAITEFIYRQFKQYGFKHDGGELKASEITAPADLIGKTFTINRIGHSHLGDAEDFEFKIVGVIDTKFNYDRYSSMMPASEGQHQQIIVQQEPSLIDMFLQREIEYERNYGFHALGYVKQSDIDAMSAYMSKIYYGPESQEFGQHMNGDGAELRFYAYIPAEGINDPEKITFADRVGKSDLKNRLDHVLFVGEEKETLAENEVLLSANMLMSLLPSRDFDVNYTAFDEAMLQNPKIDPAKYNTTTNNRIYYAKEAYDGTESDFYADPAVQNALLALYGIARPENMSAQGARYLGERLTYGSVSFEDVILTLAQMQIANFVVQNNYHVADAYKESFVKNYLKNWGYSNKYWDGTETDEWDNPTGLQSNEERVEALANAYKWEVYTNPSRFGTTKTLIYQNAWNAYLGLTGQEKTDIEALLSSYVYQLDEIKHGTNENESEKYSEFEGLKIVGFFIVEKSNYNNMIISTAVYEKYQAWYSESSKGMITDSVVPDYEEDKAEHEQGIWAFAVAPISSDNHAAIQKLVELSYAVPEETDLLFEMQNAVMYTLSSFNDMIEVLSQVFVWVGLVLAVFSAFLLMNFIATSISYKKREIGILRAVGARSSDVFKIFFSEAFIIALINFVLASIASIVVVVILNNYMRSSGINITLLSFGVIQILLMLAISVAVAFLASFLPVRGIARKKPVDAIKDR